MDLRQIYGAIYIYYCCCNYYCYCYGTCLFQYQLWEAFIPCCHLVLEIIQTHEV